MTPRCNLRFAQLQDSGFQGWGLGRPQASVLTESQASPVCLMGPEELSTGERGGLKGLLLGP